MCLNFSTELEIITFWHFESHSKEQGSQRGISRAICGPLTWSVRPSTTFKMSKYTKFTSFLSYLHKNVARWHYTWVLCGLQANISSQHGPWIHLSLDPCFRVNFRVKVLKWTSNPYIFVANVLINLLEFFWDLTWNPNIEGVICIAHFKTLMDSRLRSPALDLILLANIQIKGWIVNFVHSN